MDQIDREDDSHERYLKILQKQNETIEELRNQLDQHNSLNKNCLEFGDENRVEIQNVKTQKKKFRNFATETNDIKAIFQETFANKLTLQDRV